MKQRLTITLVLVAASAAFAALAATATAAGGHGHANRLFAFRGEVVAAGPSSLEVDVDGGNHIALRVLLGQSSRQTFSLGPGSEVLVWQGGVPRVGSAADLHPNDWVNVNVRASADSTLAEVEATPAGIVGDRATRPNPPSRPLFLYAGTVAGPQAGGHIALHVTGGNRLALRSLLGVSADQTFAYDGGTIFLLWEGRVPTVIGPSQLRAGDRITIRIRAPHNASLAEVEQTPAAHVGDHEPGVRVAAS